MCECLNCNIPMCSKCKQKHALNPRLQGHKIVLYQQMMFNANKFGKKSPGGGNESDNNNSVSPSRRGTTSTPVMGDKVSKSPKPSKNTNNDGVSMISANSSGRFSRNLFGGAQESVRG